MTAPISRFVPQGSTTPLTFPGQDTVPAFAVSVSTTLSLAAFDLPARRAVPGRSSSIDGTLNGLCLSRPVISTSLPLRSGRVRHVVLLRHPASHLVSGRLSLSLGGKPVAFADPRWLQSPIRELIDLVDGISAEGASRLLRLVLSSIPSLLGQDLGGGFPGTALALLDLLHLPQAQLAARLAVGSAGAVLSYRLPAPLDTLPGSVLALSADRITRLRLDRPLLEEGNMLHLFRPGLAPLPLKLVILGETPLLLSAGEHPPDLQPFLPWLGRRPAATQVWGDDLLHRQAASGGMTAALLREHLHATSNPPRATVHMLAATRSGILVWLDVDDRHRLAIAIRVETEAGGADVALPESGQVRAFVELPRSRGGHSRVKLRFVFGSGQISTFREGPPDRFTGVLPQGIPTEAPVEAGRALAAAWGDRIASRDRPQVENHGLRSPCPHLAIIAPMSPMPDLVRARAALVAAEIETGEIEVIYTFAGHPPSSIRHLLRETSAVYGVAHRLVSLPAPTTQPDLLMAALGATRAPSALLLGQDVLPQGPGWATRWIALLSDSVGPQLIGAALLSTDGSVEHAGGHFTWAGKSAPATVHLTAAGLPVCDLGEHGLLPTEALSADATGLKTGAIRALIAEGPISADPATMLQMAAHRLGAIMDPGARLMRFAPTPEPDAVVSASGCWQMAAFLAAAAEPVGRS